MKIYKPCEIQPDDFVQVDTLNLILTVEKSMEIREALN